MIGKVFVPGIEDRRLPQHAAQHGGLEVVDHNLLWNGSTEKLEGVLMTGEKVLHRFGDSKFDIQLPAVTEHDHEEAQATGRMTYGNSTQLSPIDLGAFAGSK